MIPLLVIVMAGMVLFGVSRFSDYADQAQNKNMEDILDKSYAALDHWISDRKTEAHNFSQIPTFIEACEGRSTAEAQNLINSFMDGTDVYENIFLATTEGELFLAYGYNPNILKIDISEIPVYAENARKAREGKIWISEPGLSPASGRPVALVTAPIKKNGNVIGILGTPVELNEFSDAYISDHTFGETGYMYMTDRKLNILAYPDREQILKLSLAEHDWAQEMSSMENGYFNYPWKGKDVLVHFRTFTETGWLIAIRVNTEQFMAPINAFKRFALTVSPIFLIIAVIMIWAVTRIIAGQIGQFVTMLKDVAEGEGDLTVRIDVASQDELGEMANWFNMFIERLQNIIRSVKESAQQVTNAAGSISAASEQMAAGAEEQQAQLSEVATSVEEMSAMILETSNNTEATQQNAQEANDAAGRGQVKVSSTINGIEGIATIVSSAASQIGTLKERSEEIGEVIQVIDDIADQTNLLALNANIEAARAGDAGRGFAVVADEVRKLAERTVSATADIGEKINQIQNDVTNSVDAMGNIADQSHEGQTLAGESGSALQDISNAIEQVNGAITQIASAAIEQSAGVEEISKNIEGVSTVSKQAATSAQELATNADQLNKEVQALEGQINLFKV